MAFPEKTLVTFQGGHDSKQDPGVVGFTRLVESKGAEYRSGDPTTIYKVRGRSLYGNVASVGRVQGLVLATYDDATTFLLAVGGQKVYYSDASNGFTGTFTALTLPDGNRNANTVKVSAAHFQNRWYLSTGLDRNVVVESDATVVNHGLTPPTQDLTVSGQSVGATDHTFTIASSTTSGTGQVFSGLDGVDAGVFLHVPEDNDTAQVTWQNLNTATVTNRQIEFDFYVGNRHPDSTPADASSDQDGEPEFLAEVLLEYSTTSGSTWASILDGNVYRTFGAYEPVIQPIGDAAPAVDIRLRAYIKSNAGVPSPGLRLRLRNPVITNGLTDTTYTNTDGALFYVYSEFDDERDWESRFSDPVQVPKDTAFGSVQVTLPSTASNASATHFKVYRTSNQQTGFTRSELGLVAKVPVGQTTISETFKVYDPTEIRLPSYEFLIISDLGAQSYYEVNGPPPAMDWIGNFKGAMFGLKNRTYYQSMPGRPHQWPEIFGIERMPFKENSPLYCGFQIGEVLWIGTESGIVLLDHPAETRAGSLRLPAPRKLEGAPGCTGAYAATPLSFGGESLIAWVSNHGVYVSNLATFERISDDIDWEATVTESSLGNAVLFWREKRRQLVLVYDSDDDGVNDSYMFFHMAPNQKSPASNLPLITLGHSGKFACWTGGRIGGVWKEFTGHASAEGVYLEEGSQTTDDSNSFNTNSDIPLSVKTGRQYFSGTPEIGRVALFHTDPLTEARVSTNSVLTVVYSTGRDEGDTDDWTTTASVTLTGAGRSKWADFQIPENGDFGQWAISVTDQTSFGITAIAQHTHEGDDRGIKE